MPIKIEITGDSQDDINALMKHFIKVDPYKCALDDLLDITRTRFKEAGFSVELTQQNPTPAEAEAIVEGIEKALATKAPRKKAAKAKDPVPDPAAAAESVKNYVVGEMIQRFGDPRQKLKAKAFIDQVTGRHGGVRLSLLDPALFPDIKVEMEEEFGIVPANGSGGEAHA